MEDDYYLLGYLHSWGLQKVLYQSTGVSSTPMSQCKHPAWPLFELNSSSHSKGLRNGICFLCDLGLLALSFLICKLGLERGQILNLIIPKEYYVSQRKSPPWGHCKEGETIRQFIINNKHITSQSPDVLSCPTCPQLLLNISGCYPSILQKLKLKTKRARLQGITEICPVLVTLSPWVFIPASILFWWMIQRRPKAWQCQV